MPALGMTWQTQTCDTARGSEWKHILIMSLSSWRDPSDIEISSLFVEAKKCPLSEEFCFGRQAQVLGQNLIPSGISRLSIQTDFISLVTTQAFEPSTWMFPGQAYSGISCPAGLLVASVASFPKSRLCLAVNRCFSVFLGCLNGGLPPAVPEADLSVKLQNGHQSRVIYAYSDSGPPLSLREVGRWLL